MRSHPSLRWSIAPLSAVVVLLIAPVVTLAGPIFGPLPTPAYAAGYTLHFAPGPGVTPPPLLPLPYPDGLGSPDAHHWQTEIGYGSPSPAGPFVYDVILVTATAGVFAFNVSLLAPGDGVLFNVTFPDIPDTGGWVFGGVNLTPFPIAFDTVVLEYPVASGIPIGAAIPITTGTATVGPPVGVGPSLTLTIVPEPAMLSLLAPVMILALRRRRA